MRSIPFHRPSIGVHEVEAVVDTLKSGWLTTGARVKQFEAAFSDYIRLKHSVAVNSCTAALHLALEAIGLRAGEVVVVPTMTFAATAEVVRYFNARPLLVDCNANDFNLDIADASRRIAEAMNNGEKVRAIIPVHYGGQICDMAGVNKLARRFELKVIEDAAHCCPAYYQAASSAPWEGVGSASDICCFSFYANKTITTGEGGMACTNNQEYADRMRIMSLHGISRDAWKRFSADGSWFYEITAPGFKYNMTDIAGAIGLEQLRKADEFFWKRVMVAHLYSELLRDVEELILPVQRGDRLHSWHLYVIRLKLETLSAGRAEIIDELRQMGIGASVHWMPLHMHPYYRDTYRYQPGDLPVASRMYPEMISLPIYPDMPDGDVEYVADAIKGIIAKHRKRAGMGACQLREEFQTNTNVVREEQEVQACLPIQK